MNPTPRTSLVLIFLVFAPVGAALAGSAVAAGPEQANAEGTWSSLGGIESRAAAMTIGPDGRIWFAGKITTEGPYHRGGLLGSLDGSGAITELGEERQVTSSVLGGLATGSDGNLWATAPEQSEIVRVTPAGTTTAFPLIEQRKGEPLAGPRTVVAGPDGAIWFTAERGSIGQITTAGAIAAFPVPFVGERDPRPRVLAVGAEGDLWFTEPGIGAIGRITTTGSISTFALTNASAEPSQIALGPDGNLWFTESGAPKVGRITPQGQITEFAAEKAGPIAAGPDGDLWFGSENGVGSISTAGLRGPTTCPSAVASRCTETVGALAQGPEGKLYFGSGPEAHEGGGGTAQAAQLSSGYVGIFKVPSLATGVLEGAKAKGARIALIKVTCSGGAAGQACGAALRLRARGRLVGTRHLFVIAGQSRWIAVKLSEVGLKMLRRRATIQAQAQITLDGGEGGTWSVILRRPPRFASAAR